ncbi:hypothetical protein NK8_53310 (plasmid) [Caballeronia sp. NK8]|nr:hypothetical protein NK8_53310 [Caballeronia sp. NK8]
MFDRNAFGLSGGAGRVDHVSKMMRSDGCLRIVLRERVIERCIGIEHGQRTCVTQRFTTSGIGEQQAGRGIGEDVAQTFARIGRIERHISGASLENRHQRDDHADTTLHAQRHAIFRTHAQRDQMMRKLIGACIELRVREGRVFEDERNGIGRALHLLFKQLMNAQMLRIRRRRVVPAFEQCVLLGQHEFMCVQRCIRLIERLLKQARKAFAQPCDGALIEQVGGVAERTGQSVLRMRQTECEIELGSSFGCGQQFQSETGQRERFHRCVL